MRHLRQSEIALIERLLEMAEKPPQLYKPLCAVMVYDLDDGGMGSIQFCNEMPAQARWFGYSAVDCFYNTAQQSVSVALYADQTGEIYELDVFTGTGEPLQQEFDPSFELQRSVVIQ